MARNTDSCQTDKARGFQALVPQEYVRQGSPSDNSSVSWK